MRIGQAFNNVIMLAIVGGCIYGLLNWDSINPAHDENAEAAERACVDASRRRFDATNIRPYGVDANSSGYVARLSVTLTRGKVIKVDCLTSHHGRVRDLVIEER